MNAPITASFLTHVGTPPTGYKEEWAKHTVHWHGFGSLPSERNALRIVYSPEFMLLGNQWRLTLFPGGSANAAEGMVTLYLSNMSNKAIEIDYGVGVIGGDGKQVSCTHSFGPYRFDPVGTGLNSVQGFTNFAERSTLLSSLVNGTLIIEIRMKLATPTKVVPPPFIPANPFAKSIQGMIIDENFGDISFTVGGQQKKNNAEKVAKITPIIFHAHRDIVANASSIFADLCESHNDKNSLNPNQECIT
jgi:hypothetical protein